MIGFEAMRKAYLNPNILLFHTKAKIKGVPFKELIGFINLENLIDSEWSIEYEKTKGQKLLQELSDNCCLTDVSMELLEEIVSHHIKD